MKMRYQLLSLVVVGCTSPAGPTTSFHIDVGGTGEGWINVDLGTTIDIICTQSCDVELPAPETLVKITVGTSQQLAVSACAEPSRSCELTVGYGDELEFTFNRDPNEIATLFLDEAAQSIAFADDGDLIIATETTLRRVGLDGAERWRLAHGASTYRVLARPGLIVKKAPASESKLTAYDAGGAVVWETSVNSLVDFTMGRDGDVIVSNVFGQVFALDPATGATRWQRSGPFSKAAATLARDSTGTVVTKYYDLPLRRFDSTGTPLSNWTPPTSLGGMAFDANDHLVASNLQGYLRFDMAGAVESSIVSGPGSNHGFALFDTGIFELRRSSVQVGAGQPVPTTLTIASLDENGAVNWEIEKGELAPTSGPTVKVYDQIQNPIVACGAAGQCAVAGQYNGRRGFEGYPAMQHWVAVFTAAP